MKAGDIVEYKKEDYLAIKVNEKSVYICKNRNFLTLWENRPKGAKWKVLCDREEALMVKPESLIVKEEGAVKVKSKQSKKDRVVSNEGVKGLKECFDRFKKREEGKKTKTPFFLIENAKEVIFPLAMNVEKNMILFHNINVDTYHFFNIEEDNYITFNKKEHKSGKDILWP